MHPGWLFGLALTVSCSGPARPEETASQPERWDEQIALPLAEDLSADPNVLEVMLDAHLEQLELQEGVLTEMWTYNGGVPGPLLRAKQGDRLIVHFSNHLPEPTTIHWHGVRVPAEMDGSHAVQNPVQPGETFTYSFVLPDAGTFWYHPHINSAAQVGYGLYGPIVVDDPASPIVADDLVLVLSDVSLEEDGQLASSDESGWFGDYFGREGALVLMNGKARPTLKMRAGIPQRWRVINAARTRFFELVLPTAQVTRIGGDAGLIETPQDQASMLLATSERGEWLVTVPDSSVGRTYATFGDGDRFGLGFPSEQLPIIDVEVLGSEGAQPYPVPSQLRPFAELDLANLPVRQIELGEQLVDDVTYLAINGEVHQEGDHAGAHTHVAYVGDTEIWEVLNATEFAHPFHLHGFAFEILDLGGAPWPVREWKDSVNIPPGEVLRFVVSYDDRPGLWMFHCHILDHAELGMMAVLEVRPQDEKPSAHENH